MNQERSIPNRKDKQPSLPNPPSKQRLANTPNPSQSAMKYPTFVPKNEKNQQPVLTSFPNPPSKPAPKPSSKKTFGFITRTAKPFKTKASNV